MRVVVLLLSLLAADSARALCYADATGTHCYPDAAYQGTSYEGSLFTLTGTASPGTGVTLTIPAQTFNPTMRAYIDYLCITKYPTAALTPSATPILVTTTNLSGLVQAFRNSGTVAESETWEPVNCKSFRGASVNTATTVVCPGTSNVLWHAKVIYHNALP